MCGCITPLFLPDLRKSYLWSWWDLRWVLVCQKARVFSGWYEWYTRLQWLVDDDFLGFATKILPKKLRWTTRISGFDGFLGWFFSKNMRNEWFEVALMILFLRNGTLMPMKNFVANHISSPPPPHKVGPYWKKKWSCNPPLKTVK